MDAKSGNATPVTRNKTEIWLVGQIASELPPALLPTTGDILKTFFYHHKILKKTIPESARSVSDDLIEIWSRARIPITHQPHVVAKLKSVVEEYSLIKKNKGRTSDTQRLREKEFMIRCKNMFDIAHKDAMDLILIEEDKVFLNDQRSCRKMIMSGEDKNLSMKEDRTQNRREKEEERKVREKVRKTECLSSTSTNYQSDDDDDDDEDEELETENDVAFEVQIPIYYQRQLIESGVNNSDAKKPRYLQRILSSPDVSSALDRINLSDRKFTILAAAIANASEQDLDEVSLSRSTVRRKRLENRSVIDSQIREQFLSVNKPPLLVHWDGKVMKDCSNLAKSKSNTDRLAVVVTGCDIEKILGIVKISSGTGQAQANSTLQLLTLWDITGDIVGMSFDTTASNTGITSGACVLLEKLLNRNLLYFACRHHVHEIIIGEVFRVTFGPTSGPNIPLFERFSKFWNKINPLNYNCLKDARIESQLLQQLRLTVGSFLKQFLTTKSSYLPRDDYKEIIELSILALGFELSIDANYHFCAPGAYHMARWMAKVIYCLKIYLFRDQFKLTVNELKQLTEFCLFATHIYVDAWISCPIASDAPYNDLQLFKRIEQYAEINKTVSQAAMKKLQNHLWYLGSEMVPLSLFSNKVSSSEKRLIVESMVKSGEDWGVRGIKYSISDFKQLDNKNLHDLITSSSTAALRSLGLDIIDLSGKDPDNWNDIPSFLVASEVVKSLKVVNDAAERSVALMSAFNQSLTKTESEMQRLIQVVEDNRNRIPDSAKRTLKAYTPRR